MVTMNELARIDRYIRANAKRLAQVVTAPNFELFLPSINHPQWSSFAMLTPPTSVPRAGSLTALGDAFAEHGLPTVVVVIEALSPRSAALFSDADFEQKKSETLMAATAGAGVSVECSSEADIIALDAHAPLAALRENLNVNEHGFNPAAPNATDADAEQFRTNLGLGRALSARLAGEAVAAGLLEQPFNGVTELVGVTTLEPFRGRGIATALAAHALRVAWVHLECDVVFLRTDDAGAARVYARAGFQSVGRVLTYTSRHALKRGEDMPTSQEDIGFKER
jgi:GNAT superfamily N-acetyltransferase